MSEKFVTGALARGKALAAGDPDWEKVTIWPRPKWSDLYGIDPDYLGGLSVEEFLDQSRDEA